MNYAHVYHIPIALATSYQLKAGISDRSSIYKR